MSLIGSIGALKIQQLLGQLFATQDPAMDPAETLKLIEDIKLKFDLSNKFDRPFVLASMELLHNFEKVLQIRFQPTGRGFRKLKEAKINYSQYVNLARLLDDRIARMVNDTRLFMDDAQRGLELRYAQNVPQEWIEMNRLIESMEPKFGDLLTDTKQLKHKLTNVLLDFIEVQYKDDELSWDMNPNDFTLSEWVGILICRPVSEMVSIDHVSQYLSLDPNSELSNKFRNDVLIRRGLFCNWLDSINSLDLFEAYIATKKSPEELYNILFDESARELSPINVEMIIRTLSNYSLLMNQQPTKTLESWSKGLAKISIPTKNPTCSNEELKRINENRGFLNSKNMRIYYAHFVPIYVDYCAKDLLKKMDRKYYANYIDLEPLDRQAQAHENKPWLPNPRITFEAFLSDLAKDLVLRGLPTVRGKLDKDHDAMQLITRELNHIKALCHKFVSIYDVFHSKFIQMADNMGSELFDMFMKSFPKQAKSTLIKYEVCQRSIQARVQDLYATIVAKTGDPKELLTCINCVTSAQQ